MILSVLFCICFILLVAAVMLVPKLEGRLNAVKMGIAAIMSVFCYLSMTAFVFNKAGIPINLKSDIVALVLANIVLWIQIIRKRKVQRMFVRAGDILALAVLAAFVLYISYHMFGTELRLSYANSDPANHFHFAMDIVVNQRLATGIYFSAYIDAIFIQLASFALPQILYFKAFIVADIFMHIMEIWMFYTLILTMSERKIVRFLAPVISIMYFWGYPSYSFLEGGFVYWSNGVVIFMFMIYALTLLERYQEKMKSIWILLFLGLYANSCCNRLFVPINTLAVMVGIAAILWKKRKHNSKKVNIVIGIVVMISLAAVSAVFIDYWGGGSIRAVIEKMIQYVSDPHGGFYRSMYADTIYFVPPLLLALYFVWKEREQYSSIYVLMTLCMLFCTMIMFGLWYYRLMSTYYFYKIYYNLWLMGMIMVVFVLDIMAEKRQLIAFFSYSSMIVLMIIISLSCYDDKNAERDPYYDSYYAMEKVMPLYRYNLDYIRKDFEEFRIPDGLLAAMDYILRDAEYGQIPITSANTGVVCWYEAITVQSIRDSIGSLELPETLKYMDEHGMKKLTVLKTDELYQKYQAFYEACDVVYENSDALVLSCGEEKWSYLLKESTVGIE